MIRIDCSDVRVPEKFRSMGEEALHELIMADERGENARKEVLGKLGKKLTRFMREVKQTLEKLFHGKCAYCETEISVALHGEIDFFRPKGGVKEDASHPGYWWLSFRWENYLFSCQKCNASKSNHFPIQGKRAFTPSDSLGGEKPLLLNPCLDDPVDHLTFKSDGTVIGETQQGKETIEILKLNRKFLIDARCKAYQETRQLFLLQQKVASFNQKDPSSVKISKIEVSRRLKEEVQEHRPYAAVRRQALMDARSEVAKPADVIGAPETKPEIIPSARHPGVVNDAVEGSDCLNIDDQVDIFARVMVSKKVFPPLAIGLFGQWGSGKSFFMDLLAKRVKNLSETAEKDSDRWQNICQVHFNAWYYMDSDLWSCLAGRIFESIAQKLQGQDNSIELAEVRRKLRNRLNSTIAARKEAMEAEKSAAARLEKIQEELSKLQIDEKEKRLEAQKMLTVLWQTINKKDCTDVSLKEFIKAADNAKKGAERLGLDIDDKRLEYIFAVPAEADSLVSDIHTTQGKMRSLVESITPQKCWHWILGLVILLLPVLGPRLLEKIGVTFDQVTAAFSQAGLVVTTIIARLRSYVGAVSNITNFADTVRESGKNLHNRVLATLTEEKQIDYKKQLTDLANTHRHLQSAKLQVAKMEQLIVATRKNLEAISAGKLVYDFVLERSGEEGFYRAREGIVSVVRRDLQTLSHLLSQWTDDDPTPPEEKTFSEEEREELPIQRIVLYIDDLDRCPTRRVVEVLQAVHLLLAFDLFIVVVGVDPRWLEHSLQDKYKNLLGDIGTNDDGLPHHPAATVKDYLEKIFQVPFSLPVVNEEGFENLISRHLKTREEIEREEIEKKDLKNANGKQGSEESDNTKHEEGDGGNENGGASLNDGKGQEPGENAVPPGDKGSQRNKIGNNEEQTKRKFFLENWERHFMAQLHPFMRTPRLIKRFVNVYRLLRVGVQEERYEEFTADKDDAPYRVVLVLLALNTGFPRLASSLLGALASKEWLQNAGVNTWGKFVKALRPPNGSNKKNSPNNVLDSLDLSERQEAELALAYPLLEKLPKELPSSIELWRSWASSVGRYSMYWKGEHKIAAWKSNTTGDSTNK